MFCSGLCECGTDSFQLFTIKTWTFFAKVGCDMLSEKGVKICPKFFSNKYIDHRIDATVDH